MAPGCVGVGAAGGVVAKEGQPVNIAVVWLKLLVVVTFISLC